MSSIVCSLMQMTVCLGLALFGMTVIAWMFDNKDRKNNGGGEIDV